MTELQKQQDLYVTLDDIIEQLYLLGYDRYSIAASPMINSLKLFADTLPKEDFDATVASIYEQVTDRSKRTLH